jgi:hypothetical protein
MNVGPVQVVRLRGRQRGRFRDRVVDHVGRTRHVRFWWLFDHDGSVCNLLAYPNGVFTSTRAEC